MSEALRTLRTQGLGVFSDKAAATLGIRRLLLMQLDLMAASKPPPARLAIDFQLLDDRSFDRFMASQPEIEAAKAYRELAEGSVCMLAVQGTQVVASAWATRAALTSDWGKVHRRLLADEAYVFGTHTVPAFRGLGISPALIGHIVERLRKEGVLRVFQLVLPWNRSSLAADRKAGFILRGQFLSFGVGRWGHSIYLVSPAEAQTVSQN